MVPIEAFSAIEPLEPEEITGGSLRSLIFRDIACVSERFPPTPLSVTITLKL